MTLSAFDDKTKQPQDDDLAAMLGKTISLWNELKQSIAAKYAPVTAEWGFACKAYGWGLRLKRDKRAILYMTPGKGYFLVSFALGEKAVAAAHQQKLPAAILKIFDDAPKYAEGRGVRFEIRSANDIHHMVRLAEIKMAN
ncbi:MAG: DUF3788 domain-containing protein [candidate division Zixibacteria bacterium]|nr:DUF3788 domain-containing protein [candidate division Zixibacteria bacterium]